MRCSECGFHYCEDIPENVARHDAYHDKVVRGLCAPRLDEEDLVWESGPDRVTLVTKASPIVEQEVAGEVAKLTTLDTRYSPPFAPGGPPDDTRVQVFLYHVANRIVGFLMIQERGAIWRATWQSLGMPPILEEIKTASPMWSVGLLWVHRGFRNKGVARCLVSQAIRRLNVSLADLGWQTEFSKDGETFVRSLYPVSFFIAK